MTGERGRGLRAPVSWAVATWTAPVAPAVVVWSALLLLVLGERLGVPTGSGPVGAVGLELVALGVALVLLGGAALVLRRSRRRGLRGAAVGMAAGSATLLVVLCVRLATP